MFDEATERPDVPEIAKKRPPTNTQAMREIFDLPDDWEWCRGEAINADTPQAAIQCDGGVFRHKYTRGPRKGRTNYRKPEPGSERRIVMLISQLREWELRWERETGLCKDCDGTGMRVSSFGVNGTKYRPCHRCGQTGAAPQPKESAA